MLSAELLHNHGLAHAAVAIDGDARHARGTRMVEKPMQDLKNMACAWIVYPAFAENGAHSVGVRFQQEPRCGGGQVGRVSHHAMSPNLPPRQVPRANRCP